jgi:hypothetical protein
MSKKSVDLEVPYAMAFAPMETLTPEPVQTPVSPHHEHAKEHMAFIKEHDLSLTGLFEHYVLEGQIAVPNFVSNVQTYAARRFFRFVFTKDKDAVFFKLRFG